MKVTFVGAGPYDKGLMTIIGMEALEQADVVLYDRLVGEEIISLIPEHCEKINVGKYSGNHHVPQEEINQLLLKKALEGLHVVRLKGGDPFLFGRGGEELELLVENNIPFQVIPGVTSSISVPCYAGIPVTHRDYSSSLHIITAHQKKDKENDIDYGAIAKLKGTLVFMMGVKELPHTFSKLILEGMDENTPSAIIENGASSMQRKFIGNLKTLPSIAEKANIVSPSIIIVGEVCKLSEKFDWFSKMPLKGNKIIVTRVNKEPSKLAKRLKKLGSDVIEFPVVQTCPLIEKNKDLAQVIENMNSYTWLVFTSGVGVNLFFDHLIDIKLDLRNLNHLKIAVVGKETERELNKRGLLAEFLPKEYNAISLGNELCKLATEKDNILILRAQKGTNDILSLFDSKNIKYKNIDLYETQTREKNGIFIENILETNPKTIITFTSGSTVLGFVNCLKRNNFNNVTAFCIGNATATLAKQHGFKTYVSQEATIESMIKKICEISGGSQC